MEALKIKEIAIACNGQARNIDEEFEIMNICIDTRKVQKGDFFVALIGEKFDAHDFIEKAYELGAALVLSEKELSNGKPYIIVTNTLLALQDIAKFYKSKFNIPFIAVTGSSGKTTTKDLIATVLSEKYNVLKTEGNFNNGIGLPLTIFNLNSSHQAAVIEMGMSSIGEIKLLADIVQPQIAVISNVGTAHIEKLGSRENILKAKLEVLENFTKECTAVINGDNDMLGNYKNDGFEVIKFGINDNNDYKATNIDENEKLETEFIVNYNGVTEKFSVPLPGIHNVYNSMAAIIVAKKLKMNSVDINNGLKKYKPSKMRMDIFHISHGIMVINDAYNANPDSMEAAVKVLANLKKSGRKVCILGDMLELGEFSQQKHYELGRFIYEIGIDLIITVGNMAEYIVKGAVSAGMDSNNALHYSNKEVAFSEINKIIKENDSILVKGSRGMKMEAFVDFFRERG